MCILILLEVKEIGIKSRYTDLFLFNINIFNINVQSWSIYFFSFPIRVAYIKKTYIILYMTLSFFILLR